MTDYYDDVLTIIIDYDKQNYVFKGFIIDYNRDLIEYSSYKKPLKSNIIDYN